MKVKEKHFNKGDRVIQTGQIIAKCRSHMLSIRFLKLCDALVEKGQYCGSRSFRSALNDFSYHHLHHPPRLCSSLHSPFESPVSNRYLATRSSSFSHYSPNIPTRPFNTAVVRRHISFEAIVTKGYHQCTWSYPSFRWVMTTHLTLLGVKPTSHASIPARTSCVT